MSLNELKKQVYYSNLELYNQGLVVHTFGNVSGFDKDEGIIAIKPSGVPYKELKVEDIVLVDLENKIIEGKFKPSSDTATHIVLYKAFPKLGGIVHTHSTYATAWAQAKKPIPCFGTTHADYVMGEVPITKDLSSKQIKNNYEFETGNQIVKRLKDIGPDKTQMILVAGHGPFTWGKNPEYAVYNSILLEEIAMIAYLTININNNAKPISPSLLNKHYIRKNGPKAYYGQIK